MWPSALRKVHSITVSPSQPLQRAQLTPDSIKKEKKQEEFDPVLVAAVEAKLKNLEVDSEAPLSGAEAIQK
jgi:hypothetical protein